MLRPPTKYTRRSRRISCTGEVERLITAMRELRALTDMLEQDGGTLTSAASAQLRRNRYLLELNEAFIAPRIGLGH